MRDLLRRLGVGADQHVEDLRAELERLHDENMRLRLERQRMLGPAASAEKARDLADAMRAKADEADDAWQAVAESHAMKDMLLRVVSEMQRAMGAAEEQLLSGTPPTELERRSRPRRRTDVPGEVWSARAAGAPDRAARLRTVTDNGDAARPTETNGSRRG